MAETLTIRTASSTEVVKIASVGPQGPKGDKGDPGDVAGLPLSVQGDLLYRGASENQRLPIGSTGQILKVAGGIPSWANESGAVTSVNGQTGAVTVAAAQHAAEHEPGEGDTIQATAALVTTNVAALNGIYFSDDTSTNGKLNFFRTGTRKNTKLQYNSSTARWELIRNAVVEAEGDEDNNATPWGQNWQDPRTPAQVTSITVARVALETMVQKLAETGAAATATTSQDGLISAADQQKLNGIAAGAEVNVQANWTEADSGSDAFILNKPATFAPSAHSSSHAAGGSDPLFDQDLNTTDSPAFSNITAYGGEITIGDLGGYGGISGFGNTIDIEQSIINGFSIITSDNSSEIFNEIDSTKKAKFSAANIATGTTRTFSFPNADGTFALSGDAPASHTHGNLTNDGKLGSTAGLPVVTTAAGAVTTLALGTANQVLRVNSGATGVEFADPAAAGVTGAASSASDVLGVSGANITGVDANADRIVFWDDSASALKYLEVSTGLSLSGTTLTATASGGSKTYAVFTAEHNQPPSTAFATLDTRNSIAVLDFDAATDENAVFVGIMPEAASLGSGLIVRLHWMATSATSGNVRWGVQFERSNTDLDADSFDTAIEATAATNGTSGIITTTAITVTTIDGITAGDVFRLKVFRNADDATNDTMTGDAELVAVEVRSAA